MHTNRIAGLITQEEAFVNMQKRMSVMRMF